MAKWAIELSEHTIFYHPQQSIKGQALADFLVEVQFTETDENLGPIPDNTEDNPTDVFPTEYWKIYVDGAS